MSFAMLQAKVEIISAADESAAAKPLKSRTNESKMANSDLMYCRVRDR